MNIVTLTTDMGTKDHYVAALKGRIYDLCPNAKVVDVTHSVKPFNISQASFFIRNVIADFPAGTIHVIGVDAEPLVDFSSPQNNCLPAIMCYQEQYFISSDNGIFNLILEGDTPESMWALDDVLSRPELMQFPTKTIFIPAACALASGKEIATIASPKEDWKRLVKTQPIVDRGLLRGKVVHVDHYGNLITDIQRKHFDHFGEKMQFVIYFRQREYYIDRISLGYNEVPAGEKVALFNSNGFLEIAINKGTPENGGGANSLFGLKVGDVVRIEFSERGSHDSLEALF